MPLQDYYQGQSVTPENILAPAYMAGVPTPPKNYSESSGLDITTLIQNLNRMQQQFQQQQFQLSGQSGQGQATGETIPQGNYVELIKKYFPQDQWNNAYQVMKGESGGRPDAVGDKYEINGVYAPSYGLFQIRALPGRPPPEQLLNPEFNVQYAAQMWQKQGWGPWTVARDLGLVKK